MPSGWTIMLNGAQLTFRSDNIDSYQLWGGSPGPFDVVEITEISLRLPRGYHGWEGRSHSLWYCDAQNESQFKWYETAFMTMALMGRSRTVEPFSLAPDGDAAGALSNVMTTNGLAGSIAGVEVESLQWTRRISTQAVGLAMIRNVRAGLPPLGRYADLDAVVASLDTMDFPSEVPLVTFGWLPGWRSTGLSTVPLT
ncbi:hypothetical protein E0H73_44430 [Kribbella pittospori]|uniref:Uncharacterized protein n=1 Tax=Kribbella pittospori TaxID=722689 RepID=A0A4R0JH63_9ACTN|nr:hypothetical protein [Kribbella pittospori]TCC45547.1 hypothetical protein E0H73_44430 [Kribbella pittospori]